MNAVRIVDPRLDTEEIERAKQQRLRELSPPERQLVRPVAYGDLVQQNPNLHEPVIDGLLRVGETANVIAPPKTGKSFLAGGLAWSVATGRPWLGREVSQGRVLILDNELHPATLANRLDRIAWAMQIDHSERGGVDVVSLRGLLTNIEVLDFHVEIEPGKYRLVVLDALYRTLPSGTSENDNAAMTAVYNRLDQLAAKWQSAILVVHHSSKGSQGDKSVVDVGAGAGSIARAADTHIAIREHDTDGHHVLEARTRSFPSPEPISVMYEYPLWTSTTLEPVVKRPTRQNANVQEQTDKAEMQELLDTVPAMPESIQQNQLREKFDHGVGKFDRLMGGLVRRKQVKIYRKTKGKQSLVFYSRVQSDSDFNSDFNSGTT